MSTHRIYLPQPFPEPGSTLTITGEEAHHALRVKRLGLGDAVAISDGVGAIAHATIADTRKRAHKGDTAWEIDVRVDRIDRVEPTRPRLDVLAASPKGERLEWMIDALSQAGAASWAPLASARTIVEPRSGKLERIKRHAIEAGKQCGRPWFLEVAADAEPTPFEVALRHSLVVLADASGDPYRASHAPRIALLIGPEGGWSTAELAAARQAGARVCRFGPHVMRVETAAVVAAGIILHEELHS